MGYRSEVAYEICFHDPNNPEVAFADYHRFANMLKTDSRFNDIAAGVGQNDSEGQFYMNDYKQALCMYADHIKWYEDYEWVRQHVRLMEVVADKDEFPTANFIFLRLGENDDDVEHEFHGQYAFEVIDIALRREIDMHSPSRESQYNIKESNDE
jgi:hypothetical protein